MNEQLDQYQRDQQRPGAVAQAVSMVLQALFNRLVASRRRAARPTLRAQRAGRSLSHPPPRFAAAPKRLGAGFVIGLLGGMAVAGLAIAALGRAAPSPSDPDT